MSISSQDGEQPLALRLLLACGIIGPLLFIIVFLLEGAARPGYSPLRHPVSALSFGDRGGIQIANFIIAGSLLLGFAIGLWRLLRPSTNFIRGIRLIGSAGVGLIGAGIFIMDPLNGYPPGTPLVPDVRSVHGFLHDLFGLPVFLGLPIACFIFRRQFASWKRKRVGALLSLERPGYVWDVRSCRDGFSSGRNRLCQFRWSISEVVDHNRLYLDCSVGATFPEQETASCPPADLMYLIAFEHLL